LGMTLETLLQTDILVFISYRTRTKWEKQFFLCGRNINYTNGRQQQTAAACRGACVGAANWQGQNIS